MTKTYKMIYISDRVLETICERYMQWVSNDYQIAINTP